MADRALVRNADDEVQVRRGKRLALLREERKRAAYRVVMGTREGRFVLWDLILRTGVFSSMWTASAEIHARAAKHDFGIDLMQQLQVAAPELYQVMEHEWWAQQKLDAAVVDAAHTKAGGQDDDTGDRSSAGEG